MSITGRTANHRLQEKCPLQTPPEESQQESHQLQPPTGKDVRHTSFKRSTTRATQPVRNRHHPDSCFSPIDFCPKRPLSTSSFSIKSFSSLLFVGFAYGCAIAGLFRTVTLCYSQINTLFAGQITGRFKENSGYEVSSGVKEMLWN